MDLNLLKYFTAVADEMSFSSAAESIYLSQSSLSKHVKRLEDDLGFQLFSRNSHTTELTPAGEALLPAARNIVRELDIVHDQLRMWSSQRCLRLASFSFFSIYHLDRFISKFISLNGMDISLVENASDSLLAMLDGDAIDAYFAFEFFLRSLSSPRPRPSHSSRRTGSRLTNCADLISSLFLSGTSRL